VVIAILGQLHEHVFRTIVSALYLVLVAALCAVIARERLGRLASRLELLDLTQEVAQVGSWEWTLSDETLSWSRELRRIFGLAEDACPTLNMFFEAVHPDDRDLVKRVVEKVLVDHEPMRFEHRIITTAGTIRWLHCRGRVVLDETGAARQLVGSSQDITDAKEMQERLLVGRKLASLGTLASGIAHEINNPLAYVATSLEIVRRRVESGTFDDPSRRSLDGALDAAQDGCRRVAEIVRGLKIFSRTDEDGTTRVDLAAVADSALAIASHEISQRARLEREYRDAPPVVGAESRLLQVVLNLVVNAAHAIEAGSRIDHEIRVRIEPTGDGRVLLAVSDTGSGIAAENVPKIFDPFFTTKAPGVGMGLGLSICHGIVRDLGGEIRVDTDEGRGTTFSVLLPAAPSVPVRTDVLGPASEPRATRLRLRVLVIDDEKSYANSLGALLGVHHDVTVFHQAGPALSRLCASEAFDVILCDLMMAGISGMDLYDALVAVQPSVLPRIVFLTGGATTERARAFVQRPGIRYVEKPVDVATLEHLIRTVVSEQVGGRVA
jgi:PAS domain S-box-containing protein